MKNCDTVQHMTSATDDRLSYNDMGCEATEAHADVNG
jgi:hypothetical protein